MILPEKVLLPISIYYIIVYCREFLKNLFPKKTPKDEPDEKIRKIFNQEQKNKIQEKIELFTKPGNPGIKFKKIFERLMTRLELPKHVKDQLGIGMGAAPSEKPQEEIKAVFNILCKN